MSPEIPSLEFDAKTRNYSEAVDRLLQKSDKWNIKWVFEQMLEKIWPKPPNSEITSYYQILVKFSLLNRSELGMFKERFILALEAARNGEEVSPYRFESNRLGCGFVVIPLVGSQFHERKKILLSFTSLNKYERRLDHCAGVSVIFLDQHIYIDWCYIEYPWRRNVEAEQLLSESGSPFRTMRHEQVIRYKTRI